MKPLWSGWCVVIIGRNGTRWTSATFAGGTRTDAIRQHDAQWDAKGMKYVARKRRGEVVCVRVALRAVGES